MSRSGYTDDCEGGALGIWRGAVASAIRGKRGQLLLHEILNALDSMPVKELIAHELGQNGQFCALGVVGQARGMDISSIDPEDSDAVAQAFGIAPALAMEIAFMNDEAFDDHEWVQVEICGPMRSSQWPYERHSRTVRMPIENAKAKRWQHMRDWVIKQLKTSEQQAAAA